MSFPAKGRGKARPVKGKHGAATLLPALPLVQLVRAAGLDQLATRLGEERTVLGKQFRGIRRGGVVDCWTADRWCIALGTHPACVFGVEWDLPANLCRVCGEEINGRYRQARYCLTHSRPAFRSKLSRVRRGVVR